MDRIGSYQFQPAHHPTTSASCDSSSVSSNASPQSKANPNMSFTQPTVPNRSTSNLSPFQNAHRSATPRYAGYDSGSISPNDQTIHNFDSFISDRTAVQGTAANQTSTQLQHNAKRAYRQRRKDPSCDACRERKVKCDATDATSCSECSSRNVRCQFTKETNRRMSSIKQVQDLERQLFQARQQVDHLRALVSNESLSNGPAVSSPSQSKLDLPPIGLPRRRRPKQRLTQDFSRVRSNLRNFSGSLLRAPAPYLRVGSQQKLPQKIPDLPPKHVADHLLGQYFDHVHLQFPILHKPTFCAEYETVYQKGTIGGMGKGWGAVLFCVFACGTMHTLDRNQIQKGKEYLTKGTSIVDFWQDEASVDQAKMAFLVSLFLAEINLKSAAWTWLGTSARLAQDAGLHVETGPWPAVEGEMRRRIWYSIYAFDRLLALELSKPLMIDDETCDTEYPEPVDDEYITEAHGVVQGGQSTPLLAIIHVVRSVQPLIRLFKSECISAETMDYYERHLEACHKLFPPPLLLSSKEPLEPRSIVPFIYLQNIRMMLHRHNLSPVCLPMARREAVATCVNIALNTSQVLSRCMGPSSATRRDLAVSATTFLCTHLWRCTLFLLFCGHYEPALILVQALSAIGPARIITLDCGRHISFFLGCIIERFQTGVVRDFEEDEELMAYVSADLQSSAENSWVWQGSEDNANLNTYSVAEQDRTDTSHGLSGPGQPPLAHADTSQRHSGHVLVEEEPYGRDSWEQIERSLHYLIEQHHQPQQPPPQQQMLPKELHYRPIAGPPPWIQPTQQRQQQQQLPPFSPGNSRMTIANIIAEL